MASPASNALIIIGLFLSAVCALSAADGEDTQTPLDQEIADAELSGTTRSGSLGLASWKTRTCGS